MLNMKFLTKSLLVSSFLVSLSPANAMDDEYIDADTDASCLRAGTLERGYAEGLQGNYLELNGKKYLVINNGVLPPTFSYYSDDSLTRESKVLGSRQWSDETRSWNFFFLHTVAHGAEVFPPFGAISETFNLCVRPSILNTFSSSDTPSCFKISKTDKIEGDSKSKIFLESELNTSETKQIFSVGNDQGHTGVILRKQEKLNKNSNPKIFIESPFNEDNNEQYSFMEDNQYLFGVEALTAENSFWCCQVSNCDVYMQPKGYVIWEKKRKD